MNSAPEQGDFADPGVSVKPWHIEVNTVNETVK